MPYFVAIRERPTMTLMVLILHSHNLLRASSCVSCVSWLTVDVKSGRHFLQIPGPTNVPDRVLRAIAQPTIDHRGPAFATLAREAIDGLTRVFQTAGPVVIYPASGTGAWEAAIVNTLSPGDTVLMVETGHFASLWKGMAEKLGIEVEFFATDWRRGVDAAAVEARLAEDKAHRFKAVMV